MAEKDLKQEINNTELQLEAAKVQQKVLQKQLNRLNRTYTNLCDSDAIKVSDHAVLRYMERMEGIDVDAIRDKVVDDEIRRQVSILGGNGTYVSADRSYRVRIEGNVLVTVIKENRG